MELTDVARQNFSPGNSDKSAIGTSVVCTEKENSAHRRTRKRFWALSRPESEVWVYPARIWQKSSISCDSFKNTLAVGDGLLLEWFKESEQISELPSTDWWLSDVCPNQLTEKRFYLCLNKRVCKMPPPPQKNSGYPKVNVWNCIFHLEKMFSLNSTCFVHKWTLFVHSLMRGNSTDGETMKTRIEDWPEG